MRFKKLAWRYSLSFHIALLCLTCQAQTPPKASLPAPVSVPAQLAAPGHEATEIALLKDQVAMAKGYQSDMVTATWAMLGVLVTVALGVSGLNIWNNQRIRDELKGDIGVLNEQFREALTGNMATINKQRDDLKVVSFGLAQSLVIIACPSEREFRLAPPTTKLKHQTAITARTLLEGTGHSQGEIGTVLEPWFRWMLSTFWLGVRHELWLQCARADSESAQQWERAGNLYPTPEAQRARAELMTDRVSKRERLVSINQPAPESVAAAITLLSRLQAEFATPYPELRESLAASCTAWIPRLMHLEKHSDLSEADAWYGLTYELRGPPAEWGP